MTTLDNQTAAAETPADFPQVADQYRRELTAHCYRMTGSVYDAEDMVQETYLRAWRAYDDFEGRSSVRTWLYRIATNVCLTNLESKGRRPLPTGLGMPGATARDELVEATEVPWLEPVPDVMVDVANIDPAQVVGNRDSIRLAFVAALQHLPPKQRAVLVLRDVLRWSAKETATALETTVAAVNSALQRAHAQLAEKQLTQGTVEDDLTPELEAMLDRYVQAFWDKDVNALVTMLAHDAIWEMPPFTGWYAGAENIAALIDHQLPGRRARHADDPYVGQRAAGVRPLHAPAGRATSSRSSSRCCRSSTAGCSTCGVLREGAVRDLRTPDLAACVVLPDSGLRCPPPRHRPRWRCSTAPSPGRTAACSWPAPATSHLPTPCADWDLGDLLAHMEDVARGARRSRRARPRPRHRPASSAPTRAAPSTASSSAPAPPAPPGCTASPRRRSTSATSPWAATPSRWWAPWRSPCTAGTSPRRWAAAVGSPRTWPPGCTTWRWPS